MYQPPTREALDWLTRQLPWGARVASVTDSPAASPPIWIESASNPIEAALGNRSSEVGHCRLDLAVLFGPDAAADHLAAYERAAGVRVDRRADLRALLCFTPQWQDVIPRKVAGRAPLDVAGMPDRVAATVRAAVDGIE